MKQVYWFCLAYAAKLHGVVVHAACLMSTHAHEVITDVRGEYPKFLETFHRNLALCTKALRGWPEEVFNKDSTGVHALLTAEAVIESIAYLIANPVEAGAVRYAKDWPGAHTLPADVGTRVVRVQRPKHYFDPDNAKWPDALQLGSRCRCCWSRLRSGAGPRAHRGARTTPGAPGLERSQTHRSSVHRSAAREKAPHTKRASSYEVFGSLNPQFAAAGSRAAATEAVRRLRAFKAQYERALGRWMAGDRTACFPTGTWWMWVCHGGRCGPGP